MEPTLSGVPETTLWTLFNRATDAERVDSPFEDPHAIRLRDQLAYPFRQRFGAPSQAHPLRARAFDAELAAFLDVHPDGAVVALGEGLQTTYWRLGRRVSWLSVDLPEIVELRRALLPQEPDVRQVAASALDTAAWMDRAGDAPTIVTAEGLLMYFAPEDALGLIAACARRFPGGRMLLDTIPPWFSRRTLSGARITTNYEAPPMPWGITAGAMRGLDVPGVAAVREVRLPAGRGPWQPWLFRLAGAVPVIGDQRPACWCLEFSSPAAP